MSALSLFSLTTSLMPVSLRVPARASHVSMSIDGAGWRRRQPSREEMILKNFLCQRAMQTQLYYYAQMHNDKYKDWLINFAEERGCAPLFVGGKLTHSHTALTVPWDELLTELMNAPEEQWEIEVTWGRQPIGGRPPPLPPLSDEQEAKKMSEEEAKAAWLAKMNIPNSGPAAEAAPAAPGAAASMSTWYMSDRQRAMAEYAAEQAAKEQTAKEQAAAEPVAEPESEPAVELAPPEPLAAAEPQPQPQPRRLTEEEAKAAWLAKVSAPTWGPPAPPPPPAAAPSMADDEPTVNPYLPQPEPTTYTTTIKPLHIGQALITVREQLAKEWRADFKLLPLCNAELRRHHAEEVVNVTDEVENMQYQITPGEVDGEDGGESPLRKANFDLIKTAATHGALMRLQKELESEPTERHTAEWLHEFVRSYGGAFLGGGAYGWREGRSFILTMMSQPMTVGTSLGGNPRFLDPLSLAERLMDLRAEVASEWAEAMEHVPAEHVALRLDDHRASLEASMSSFPTPRPPDATL